MFGVPFILQVPREGLDHDRLYELIVNRMKRYLTIKEEEQSHGMENNVSPPLQSNNPNGCESEMETEESNVSPDLENGNELKPPKVNGAEPVVDPPHPARLFTMDSVNLSGNSSLGRLKQNGKSLTFGGTF